MKERLKKLAAAIPGWRPDALMVSGGAMLSYGVWMAWEPGGFMVGGLLILAVGWLDSKAAK
jgi:hypothetical protein